MRLDPCAACGGSGASSRRTLQSEIENLNSRKKLTNPRNNPSVSASPSRLSHNRSSLSNPTSSSTQHCSTYRNFPRQRHRFQHEAATDLFCRRFALYIGVSWLSSLSELFRLQLNNSRYISICQPIIFHWTFYCTVKCFFRLSVVFFRRLSHIQKICGYNL